MLENMLENMREKVAGISGGANAANKPDKVKYKNAVCVSVDAQNSKFHFYSVENGDDSTLKHEKKEYRSRLYSADFMAELSQAAQDFSSNNSLVSEASITLLIPDGAVAMDTVNIPYINHRRNAAALDASIAGLYKNVNELDVSRFLFAQNKQFVTYSIAIMNEALKKSLIAAMTDGGMAPTQVTFMSNATVNAANQLCPKMRNSSYLILDIKKEISRFAFVLKGRTVGYYSLPFGYSIMEKRTLAAEDMLFDHSIAELAVLNAKEKAKAKQLTMMQSENNEESELNGEGGENAEANLDAMFGDEENATADPTANAPAQQIKTLPKKMPRKLPKFMLRPLPHTEEEYGFENFRIFIKWALNLLASNDKLTSQAKMEAVYVNMPEEFNYLFEMTQKEREENKIDFKALDVRGNSGEITSNLELYGGLFATVFNRNNNFYPVKEQRQG